MQPAVFAGKSTKKKLRKHKDINALIMNYDHKQQFYVDVYHIGALGRVVDDWRPHGDGGRPEQKPLLGVGSSRYWRSLVS